MMHQVMWKLNSTVLVDKQWIWRPARSEDLVTIQSLLPSIQLGEADEPTWLPSKSSPFSTYKTWKAIRFKYYQRLHGGE